MYSVLTHSVSLYIQCDYTFSVITHSQCDCTFTASLSITVCYISHAWMKVNMLDLILVGIIIAHSQHSNHMCKLNILDHSPSRASTSEKWLAKRILHSPRSKLTLTYMYYDVVRNDETDFQNTFWRHSNYRHCLGPSMFGGQGLAYPSNKFPHLIFIIMPLGEETIKWPALLLQTQADSFASDNQCQTAFATS